MPLQINAPDSRDYVEQGHRLLEQVSPQKPRTPEPEKTPTRPPAERSTFSTATPPPWVLANGSGTKVNGGK